jgi:hypothetical protein
MWKLLAVTIVHVMLIGSVNAQPGRDYEKLVNKKLADHLFGLKKWQWDNEAKKVLPSNWPMKIMAPPDNTGGIIYAQDPSAGRMIEIIPFFWDANFPTSFVMVTFYSRIGATTAVGDKQKATIEMQVQRSLGSAYSLEPSFSRKDNMDMVQFIIKRKQTE